MAIVGGAKVSTKLDLLDFLLGKVDMLVIGGAMANTLLFAAGRRGRHVAVERDMADDRARHSRAGRAQRACELMLPIDAVVAREACARGAATADRRRSTACREDRMILDIGPQQRRAPSARGSKRCRTLVWNGPVGAFETQPFDAGTMALAQAVARADRAPASSPASPAAATRSRRWRRPASSTS